MFGLSVIVTGDISGTVARILRAGRVTGFTLATWSHEGVLDTKLLSCILIM